ncbi:MAG: flagellar type III secretion system protein FliR [Syntrophaceae bacterium]|nr:flagellar type III secretion system protein FliR [Syntrophaceae bacterium]
MNIPMITPDQIGAFLFVFLRMSAMIALLPIFGDRPVLLRVRAGLSLILSFLVFPFVDPGNVPAVTGNVVSMILSLAGEVLVGVILGFAVRFVFAGIQYAGELAGLQMGFYIANVLDPVSNGQVSVIAEIQYMMALVVFLVVDGHHVLLQAVTESFRILPLGGLHISGPLVQTIFDWTRGVFVIALKIGAPIMAALIFTNVALGIVARTVPQINVFIVGFPLQIAVGFLFLGLSVPIFITMVARLFSRIPGELGAVLRLM